VAIMFGLMRVSTAKRWLREITDSYERIADLQSSMHKSDMAEMERLQEKIRKQEEKHQEQCSILSIENALKTIAKELSRLK